MAKLSKEKQAARNARFRETMAAKRAAGMAGQAAYAEATGLRPAARELPARETELRAVRKLQLIAAILEL